MCIQCSGEEVMSNLRLEGRIYGERLRKRKMFQTNILVSCCCWNKLPQIQWLKIRNVMVPVVRSPKMDLTVIKSRCQSAGLDPLQRLQRRIYFLAFLIFQGLLAFLGFWSLLPYSKLVNLHLHFFNSGLLSLPLIKTLVMTLGPPDNPR